MPLLPGKGKKVVSENISEFHKGKTFAATAAKFGKKKADAQAVAAAMSKKQESGGGHGVTMVPHQHVAKLRDKKS
jgi:hypothetical protein